MPYVIGAQKIFPEVEKVSDIKTGEWIELADGAANIVGSMGAQFSMTKDDMLGNIKKIRTKYETDKEKFETFEALLQDEIEKKENKNDKSGTVGGLWLKRGLEYLCEVFCELIMEHKESKGAGKKSSGSAVQTACKNAYQKTLTKHHNMATRMIVKAALMASPYKETLMTNLASGEKDQDDAIIEEMTKYEQSLRKYMIVVGQLYKDDPCLQCSQTN